MSENEAADAQARKKSLSRLFMKRITLLSLVFSLIVGYFYVIGNFQLFLDDSQRLLLSILTWVSIFSTGLSLIGLVVLSLSKRKESIPRKALGLSGYALSALISLILVMLSSFLRSATR